METKNESSEDQSRITGVKIILNGQTLFVPNEDSGNVVLSMKSVDGKGGVGIMCKPSVFLILLQEGLKKAK